jgi:hypothetical protein
VQKRRKRLRWVAIAAALLALRDNRRRHGNFP